MLLTEYLDIKIAKNSKYYQSLGYDIPMKKASPSSYERYKKEYVYDNSVFVKVPIKDVPLNSLKEVRVKCDICGEEKSISYEQYNFVTNNNTTNYFCKKCSKIKIAQNNMEKYGVSSVLFLDSVQEKIKSTNLVKYGVENYSSTQECREKVKDTIQSKYGVDNVFQLDETKEKSRQTALEKYGIKHAALSEEATQKRKKTNFEKYGTEYVVGSKYTKELTKQKCIAEYGIDNYSKLDFVKEKKANTFYNNGSKISSTQQRYLNDYYKGELNYKVSYYCVDIGFPDEHLAIEYNGSGHNLQVKYGNMSQRKFELSEIKRNNSIKKAGWKLIIIESKKDLLPQDEVLDKMLQFSRDYFKNNPDRSWIQFNIDDNIYRNALHKGGEFFNFGELRKINKSA